MEQLADIREELEPAAGKALKSLMPGEPEPAAGALLDMIREFLEGRGGTNRPGRGGRRRKS